MSDDAPLLTAEQALALMARVWDAFERSVLDHAAAETVAAGFAEDDVHCVIERLARGLRERRPARLETARQMLEARQTSLQ